MLKNISYNKVFKKVLRNFLFFDLKLLLGVKCGILLTSMGKGV